ncbi:MAG TPA: hypothetical protein VF406_05815, partial [Thermodesulfobacteriota bacterium]
MHPTSPKHRLAAAITATGVLVATGVVTAWGQTSGTVQPDQPGQLDVPGKGPAQPEALPGQRTQPGDTQRTGPLKEQAVQQGTSGTTDDRLAAYVKARQQLERDDPSMRRALETGDFAGRMDTVRAALRGSQMTPEEFVQMHEQVQRDPALEAQVEAQLGAASGTSGSARGTGVPHPAGGAEVPAG